MFQRLAILASIASAISAQPAQAGTWELKPSADWYVAYADDSCRLARSFGEGKDQMVLRLDQFAPADTYATSLSGEQVSSFRRGMKASAGFYPGTESKTLDSAWVGSTSEKTPIVLLGEFGTKPIDPDKGAATVSVANREFRFTWSDSSIKLSVGSMAAAITAMRACTANLVKGWGLDPVQQAALRTRPIPRTFPGGWLTTADYPPNLLDKREGGLISFRLMIGENGKPTACAIQQSTQSPQLRDLTCKLLMKRAKFRPALDNAGKAQASYFVEIVVWVAHP